MRRVAFAVGALLLVLSTSLTPAFAGAGGKSAKAFAKEPSGATNSLMKVDTDAPGEAVPEPDAATPPAAGDVGSADEKATPSAKGTKPKGKPKAAAPQQGFLVDTTGARATSGRVPRGYGSLNLTQPQRERIYGIQAVYGSKIKELEATIDRLKAEEAVQIENVLLPPQRAALARYKALQAAK